MLTAPWEHPGLDEAACCGHPAPRATTNRSEGHGYAGANAHTSVFLRGTVPCTSQLYPVTLPPASRVMGEQPALQDLHPGRNGTETER